MSVPYVKADPSAPPGFYEVEAAGLRWLAEVPDGVSVVPVRDVGASSITLARLDQVAPTRTAAEDLGRRLAVTHAAGAPWFGAPPDGWAADGFIGPLPLPHALGGPPGSFGEFYARYRLEPFLGRARDDGTLDGAQADRVDRLVDRIAAGELGADDEAPSRIHGDLWSGNVLWTPSGVVLVDPAAHGGHRETDLAMLALFGLPRLDTVLAAYDEAAPLAAGWRERVPLHQLHPLLVHVVLFGGGYVGSLLGAVGRFA
ncbi:MAG: fructosamine kinase family protein [Actinomycetes bacterium]